MKFFPVMLLASMAYASSVSAHSKEQNDAEERRAILSQSDSSNSLRRSRENVVSNENVLVPQRDISKDISREDVLLHQKVSNSDQSPEKESMRKSNRNSEIVELEEKDRDQSKDTVKNLRRDGKFANLGLKMGAEMDEVLITIKNKMKRALTFSS